MWRGSDTAVSSSSRHPCPCSVHYAPEAPAIHPTSSCSQQWWQVLVVLIGPSHHRRRRCQFRTLFASVDVIITHCPPCEQWLAAMVMGAESPLGHYLFRRVCRGLVVTWREYRVGAYLVAALATCHLPGLMLDPKEPLTSHLNGEEGLDGRRAPSFYLKNVT
jgi:hypothetical protein